MTWSITEDRHSTDPSLESVFAVANGYLGLRGTPEEGKPAHDPGAILNGLHETWPIVYPEDAYGLARTGQTIVNATDGSIIRLFVDDEPFDLATAKVHRFERVLDMKTGVLHREVEFETERGQRLLVCSTRLASFEHRHLAAMSYEVSSLDSSVRIAVCSELVTYGPGETSDDPRRGKGFAEKVLEPVSARADGARAVLQLATRNSGLELAVGMEHEIDGALSVEVCAEGDNARVVVLADLEPGEHLSLSKYVAYHWSATAPEGDLTGRVERTLDRAALDGYEQVERQHRGHVAKFWRRSDVEIEGAPDLQRAVRFTCSSSCRRPLAPRVSAWRRRAPPAAATRGTTSGTPRSTSSRSSPTPARAGRVRCSTFAAGCWAPRASGRARSAIAGRCTRGGRSTARRHRPGTRPAPRSTTSTPTSRTRSATTPGSRATSASCSATARRRSWRPRGCGWSSGSFPSGGTARSASTV
jgi:alpha,alpha-trehalose phosphorylase